MSGPAIIVVASLFLIALLAIGGVMAWQEARVHTVGGPPEYIIEDAVATAFDRLDEETRARISRSAVRRIIEWEVFFLQGLADKKAARNGITVVAGGDHAAVAFIVEQLNKRGHEYRPEDVRAVLAGEAEYLMSIGAIGSVAGEEV